MPLSAIGLFLWVVLHRSRGCSLRSLRYPCVLRAESETIVWLASGTLGDMPGIMGVALAANQRVLGRTVSNRNYGLASLHGYPKQA